jgi:glycerol-3-phosphate dehydrogenase (NAD(P)+)
MKKGRFTPHIVAVLGAGNFGTAIAQVLAENGHRVHLWNWEQDHLPLKQIEKYHENRKYMPGVRILKNVVPTYKIEEAVADADIVFLAVPSMAMEHVIGFAARNISNKSIVVNLTKGLHPDMHIPMSKIISKHVRPQLRKHIVTISGPAVARQLVHHGFTMMNIASKNQSSLKKVRHVLENDFVKLIPTKDILGVEVGGSFKNVYAILIGVCEGMKLPLNTQAALLTLALGEIEDMIHAMGGKRATAHELAGLGDLIGTALCKESRNHRFGHYLAKGLTVAQARKKVGQTVEGIDAVKCLHSLARAHKQNLPIAHLVHSLVNGKGDVKKKMERFLKQL